MFPGYVWNDVGNEVGRIGNYRRQNSPILHTLSAGSIEASEGPEWDLAQEVKYSNIFSFPVLYPGAGVCSYFPEVITDQCPHLRGWHWSMYHYTALFPSSHSASDVWMLLLVTGTGHGKLISECDILLTTLNRNIHLSKEFIIYVENILTPQSNSLSTIINIIEAF